MTGVTQEQLDILAAPTPEDEIKQRPAPGRGNKMLDYVDARFIMQRLDEAVGTPNWQDEYRMDERSSDGVICRLGIRMEDGEWVWKEDVGTESNIENTKGSFSDAFKRAAVKWGIARDLYEERAAGVGHRPTERQNNAHGNQPQRSQSNGGERPKPVDVDPEDAPWVCPTHNAVQAWPAGKAASTGRAYDAFYACPEGRECPNRAPRTLKVKPEHLGKPADSFSDLPF